MKLIVRDYVGYYYELECVCDDTVGIIVEHYKRMRRDSVVLDETQYQYVVRGGGVIFERTQVLEDIGLSDESTLRIDIRKMKVEFESIDFEQKLKFKNCVLRGTNDLERAMNKLEVFRNLIDKFGDDEDKYYYSIGGPIEQQIRANPDNYGGERRGSWSLGNRANKVYLNWLSQLANDGWEIVDVYYHWFCQGMSNEFPKILFQRKI